MRYTPATGAVASVSLADPDSNYPTPTTPSDIELDAGDVWLALPTLSRIARISDASLAVERTIEAPGSPYGLAVAASSLWVTLSSTGDVVQLNRETGETLATVHVGFHPTASQPAGAFSGSPYRVTSAFNRPRGRHLLRQCAGTITRGRRLSAEAS